MRMQMTEVRMKESRAVMVFDVVMAANLVKEGKAEYVVRQQVARPMSPANGRGIPLCRLRS